MTDRVPRWDDPLTEPWHDLSSAQRQAARAVHNRRGIVLGTDRETGDLVLCTGMVHIPAVEDELIRAERRDDEETQ
jgi:hypothetical protein